MEKLLPELRRRNVFRVAGVYAVIGWLLVQVIVAVLPTLGAPVWVARVFIVLVAAGFPIALVLAWAFELTPEGVKLTKDVAESESIAPKTGRRLDYAILAGFALVVIVIAADRFMPKKAAPQDASTAASLAAPIPSGQSASPGMGKEAETDNVQSIAVLPFTDLSPGGEQQYFGDGLSEELLNVLAQIPNLKVAGRTSSFSFRNSQSEIGEIGAALGVGHVLEGSVRRDGDKVRVTAQLIRTADDFHLWSQTFDRPFADILSVQDEIVAEIARILAIRLGAAQGLTADGGTENAAAYEQFLRGRSLFETRNTGANRFSAIDAFQTAVDIDPSFAAAWGALARALVYSAGATGESDDFWRRGHDAAERALALDPKNAEAHVALSNWNMAVRRDWRAAGEQLEAALALAPNAAYAHYHAAQYYAFIGDRQRMAASIRRTVAMDPLNQVTRNRGVDLYLHFNMPDEAERLLAASSLPDIPRSYFEMIIARERGDAVAFENAHDRYNAARRALIAAGQPDPDDQPELSGAVARLIAADLRKDENRDELAANLERILRERSNGDFSLDAYQGYLLIGDYAAATAELAAASTTSGADHWIYVDLPFKPEGYRCLPAYRALWELPGIPELMEMRRANGAVDNLPKGDGCDDEGGNE